MPIQGKYKELTEQWEVNYGLTSCSATRVFHDDTTEIGLLPSVGDPLGSALPDSQIFVENISKRKLGGHPSKHLYTVTYGPRLTGGTGYKISTDPSKFYARNYQMGMEVISVKGEAGSAFQYKWPDGKVVLQRIPFKVPNGTFTIERRSSKSSFPRIQLQTNYIGRVNSVTFEGYAASTVLLEGVTGNEYINDAGYKRYKVVMTFRWRYYSWQMLLRESTGAWAVVTPDMFSTADLNDLLKPNFF